MLWLSGLLGVGDLAAIALLFYNAIAVGGAGPAPTSAVQFSINLFRPSALGGALRRR